MDRKKFLKKIGLGIIGSSTLAKACTSEVPNTKPTEDCKLTGQDVLGPFFVNGTPNVVNINTQNLPGTPMLVKGTVYGGEDMSTPLANARIDVWHADNGGAYHPEGSGDVSDYDESEISLRGYLLTDADGSYAFSSIVPGLYGSRARHIHFKVAVAGYQTLVTQTYFEGDKRITQDSLSRDAGTCRIISFNADANGVETASMDFHLGLA